MAPSRPEIRPGQLWGYSGSLGPSFLVLVIQRDDREPEPDAWLTWDVCVDDDDPRPLGIVRTNPWWFALGSVYLVAEGPGT